MKEENQNNNLDLLIKLGVFLILLATAIFATTTWNSISDGVKLVILFVMGIAFYALSFVVEDQLKLPKSALAYWVISMLFFFSSILAIGAFHLFGEWFSFENEGAFLLKAILSLCGGGLLFRLFQKTTKSFYMHSSWYFFYLAIIFLFTHLFGDALGILFLQILLFIPSFLSIENPIFKSYQFHSRILAYIFIFVFFCISKISLMIYVCFFLLFVCAFCYQKFASRETNQYPELNFILPTYTFAFLVRLCIELHFAKVALPIFIGVCVIHNCFIHLFIKNKDKNLRVVSFILSTLICIISIFTLIPEPTNFLIAMIVYFFFHLENIYFHVFDFEKYLTPFKLPLLIFAISLFIHTNIVEVNSNFVCGIIVFVILALGAFIKNKNIQIICYILNCIFIFVLAGLLEPNSMIDIISGLVLALALVIQTYFIHVRTPQFRIFNYIYNLILSLMLLSVMLHHTTILYSILTIILYLLMSYLVIDEKYKNLSLKISIYAIIVPFTILIHQFDSSYISLFVGIYLFMITYLYEFYFKGTNKKVAIDILMIFAFLSLISDQFIISYIILGIQLALYIVYFNGKNDYKSEYIISLVLLGLLILNKLAIFLNNIPAWAYLFIAGISIIVIVTKKEFTKKNSSSNPSKQIDHTALANDIEQLEGEIKTEYKSQAVPIKEKKFCGYCGSPLVGEKKFCSNCGKKVS